MDFLIHLEQIVAGNGFTWKNVAGIIFGLWIIRNLYQALKTGVVKTMWNTSRDIRKAKILFVTDFLVMIVALLCMGAFALGFTNGLHDNILNWPK